MSNTIEIQPKRSNKLIAIKIRGSWNVTILLQFNVYRGEPYSIKWHSKGDHSFSTFINFSEKLASPPSHLIHRLKGAYQKVKTVSFSRNFGTSKWIRELNNPCFFSNLVIQPICRACLKPSIQNIEDWAFCKNS